MSCPDWRNLTARRDADPDAWHRAVAHLDECSRCRREALAAEPTLVFRRLPTLELGAEEIADMQRAVATMRRTRSMERPRRRIATPPVRTWLRAAALAAVMLGAALLRGTGPAPIARVDHGAPQPGVVAAGPVEPAGAVHTTLASFDPAQLPLVEDMDPSYGSLIQVVNDDIAIVMVVAQARENLDV